MVKIVSAFQNTPRGIELNPNTNELFVVATPFTFFINKKQNFFIEILQIEGEGVISNTEDKKQILLDGHIRRSISYINNKKNEEKNEYISFNILNKGNL